MSIGTKQNWTKQINPDLLGDRVTTAELVEAYNKSPAANNFSNPESRVKKIIYDGLCFDSPWECNVYKVLRLLETKGIVRNIERVTKDYDKYWFTFREASNNRGGTKGTFLDFRFELLETEFKSKWMEVKGRLDPKSSPRIRRFRRDYLDDFNKTIWVVEKNNKAHKLLVKLSVRPENVWFYGELKKQYSHLVDWK